MYAFFLEMVNGIILVKPKRTTKVRIYYIRETDI